MTDLIKQMEDELENRIIPFWSNLVDSENGGFYGKVDHNLDVILKSPKGCVLNSRILWFYSSLFRQYSKQEYLDLATHAYKFMASAFYDKVYGGLYWLSDDMGSPIDESKHTYNQAFAIYALSEYTNASGSSEALGFALELFELIESKCTDEYGYLEQFDRQWNPQLNDKLSENGLLADKTMNTLLHLLEAYTTLYQTSNIKKVAEKLLHILYIFRDKVYNIDKRRLEVFFDQKMKSISDLHSYGHDIEASWLIEKALYVLNEKGLVFNNLQIDNKQQLINNEQINHYQLIQEMHEYTIAIVDNVIEKAYVKNKGIIYECFNGQNSIERIWWVQAEGIVGLVNAFQKSGNLKYMQIALDVWEYVKNNVIDYRKGGEWFWSIDELNASDETKPIVDVWKCPYHNGRMCFEVIERLGKQ